MNPSYTPKVSIIIPVYNGANYMREAIDSALSQTYPNIEVIVVNDGSSDNGETDGIAKSYGDRIVYIVKENGGVATALNRGISEMSGEFFSWLSHDDVYGPEKIRHQIDALSAVDNKKSVALCAHCFINENSEKLSKNAPERFTEGTHDWQEVIWEILLNGAFSGCALLIPKEAFDECGGFHEGMRFSQDALMWMKIFLKKYPLVYNADEDVCSRIHGKQLTETGRKLFQKDSLTMAEILIPELIKISTKKRNYLYLSAKRNARYGNGEVVKFFVDAGKPLGLLGFKQRLLLKMDLFYGSFRPALRKAYYRLFVKAERNKKV